MNAQPSARWRTPSAVLLLAAGTALAWVMSNRAAGHAEQTLRQQSVLERMWRADAVLSASVLDLRHGHALHFDEVVTAQRDFSSATDVLRSSLETGVWERDADAIEKLVAAAANKGISLERFKSAAAILRNSQRYFPLVASKVAGLLARARADARSAEALQSVVIASLDSSSMRRRGEGTRPVDAALTELRAAVREFRAELLTSDELLELERQSRLVTRRRLDADQAMAGVTQTRLDDLLQDLRCELIERSATAAASAKRHRGVLIFVVFGLLLALVSAWLRLKRSHTEISEANEQLESRIQARTAELEKASRAKSEFLANMSDEIRTPMNAILGYADVLRDGEASADEVDHAVESIHRNCKFLLAIINDILDLSKIEAGRMNVERLEVDPTDVVRNVFKMMEQNAAQRGLDFQLIWPAKMPAKVYTDPTRWTQVLMNLVSNALKFTESGSVILRVDFDAGEAGALAVIVRDTGIGIEESRIPTLFDAFTQADASTTRRFGGTGLGLAVSARIVELLGGEIRVRSELGVGSEFEVRVATGLTAPLEAAGLRAPKDGAAPAPGSESSSHALRQHSGHVLLVEDGRDNQILISRALRKRGLQVSIAENGQEACDALLGGGDSCGDACGGPFDLVLMDMQMPTMDGYTAASRVRNAGLRTPIVAITAHALEGDRQRCIDAGCDDYITKPVDWRVLNRMLDRYLSASPAKAAIS